jgi:hypothetical protein
MLEHVLEGVCTLRHDGGMQVFLENQGFTSVPFHRNETA